MMSRAEKIFAWVFFALVVAAFFCGTSYARDSEGDTTAGAFIQDEGNNPQPFSTVVGTQNPVRLYCPKGYLDRSVAIVNPSSNHSLMISSWSAFTATDNWCPVLPSSGTFSQFTSGATYYALYPPGTSSETVRGIVGRNKPEDY